ncbi:MAG: hypothetical protein K0Q48_1674 [Bacillota bacterium]|nr:hypothetical protein [Bacillota bacterium]
MNIGLNKIMNKDEKIIDTPTLRIKDNILSFDDYFILVSNISQVSIAPVTKKAFPKMSILLIVVGLLFFTMESLPFLIIALAFVGGGLYLIYTNTQENNNRGDNLSIQMNSGEYFIFNCKDREFLKKIMDVLQSCANKLLTEAKIDLTNSVINYGDNNLISNKVEAHD